MALKRIFSAGGIIVKNSEGGPRVLVTQHSGHKGWDFPKGHIELGESAEVAALREVEEETGVKAEIVEKAGETKYFYHDSGEKVLKTVTFFLMKYIEVGKATTAYEVSGKVWLDTKEVENKLTFKDTKELWNKVRKQAGDLK